MAPNGVARAARVRLRSSSALPRSGRLQAVRRRAAVRIRENYRDVFPCSLTVFGVVHEVAIAQAKDHPDLRGHRGRASVFCARPPPPERRKRALLSVILGQPKQTCSHDRLIPSIAAVALLANTMGGNPAPAPPCALRERYPWVLQCQPKPLFRGSGLPESKFFPSYNAPRAAPRA